MAGAVRALKMHGGGPPVVAGKPLDQTYKSENIELVAKGCCNLGRHIANARKYGVPVVIAINKFACDTDAELDTVRRASLEAGAPGNIASMHACMQGVNTGWPAACMHACCRRRQDRPAQTRCPAVALLCRRRTWESTASLPILEDGSGML